jgi:general transcription factor 3C polypeptide 5 (transcription factor C subunit 1)
MAYSSSAPNFTIPTRQIVAVEHPMVVKNIDKGLKTFGCFGPSKQVS